MPVHSKVRSAPRPPVSAVTASGSDSFVTSTTSVAPAASARSSASARVSATISRRGPRSAASLWTSLPMKPAPIDHDVVAEPHVGELHGVDRARQRLGQRLRPAARPGREAVRRAHGDVLREPSLVTHTPDPVADGERR